MNTGDGTIKRITEAQAKAADPTLVFRIGEEVQIVGKAGTFRVSTLGRGEIVLKPLPIRL